MPPISTNPRQPTQINLFSVTLERLDGSNKLDITGTVAYFDVVSSINSQTIYGHLGFIDDAMIVEQYPIVGEEIVTIQLQTIGSTAPLEYKFIIDRTDILQPFESNDGTNVGVSLVSFDFYTNTVLNKSNSYTGTADQIITQILQTELRSDESLSIFTPTDNNETIAFTYMKPFEKIQLLTRRSSVADSNIAGLFTFFQNSYGYNFTTIENIIKLGLERTIKQYVYGAATGSADDNNIRYKMINAIKVINNFNQTNKMAYGYYNTQVLEYDIITKSLNLHTVNADQKNNQQRKLQSEKGKTNTQTLIDILADRSSLQYLVPRDTTRQMRGAQALVNGAPLSISLFQRPVQISIHGDMSITSGDVVNVNIPQSAPNSLIEKGIDQNLSGNYLVHTAHHTIYRDVTDVHSATHLSLVNDNSLIRKQVRPYQQSPILKGIV